jgi:Tfp pilus assembly protein PilP
MRLVPEETNHVRIDGPGAFGPLSGTLSLDCLRFKGLKKDKHGIRAILVDEHGKSYTVHKGEMVGENGGEVADITSTQITISQLVKGRNGKYRETLRYLFLDSGK